MCDMCDKTPFPLHLFIHYVIYLSNVCKYGAILFLTLLLIDSENYRYQTKQKFQVVKFGPAL